MKALLSFGILTFTFFSFSQEDDLSVEKETMNSYLDEKAERVQIAKDCVMNARGSREVKRCRALLEEKFDDHAKRIKENRNGS
jgi:hypothetical protein